MFSLVMPSPATTRVPSGVDHRANCSVFTATHVRKKGNVPVTIIANDSSIRICTLQEETLSEHPYKDIQCFRVGDIEPEYQFIQLRDGVKFMYTLVLPSIEHAKHLHETVQEFIRVKMAQALASAAAAPESASLPRDTDTSPNAQLSPPLSPRTSAIPKIPLYKQKSATKLSTPGSAVPVVGVVVGGAGAAGHKRTLSVPASRLEIAISRNEPTQAMMAQRSDGGAGGMWESPDASEIVASHPTSPSLFSPTISPPPAPTRGVGRSATVLGPI